MLDASAGALTVLAIVAASLGFGQVLCRLAGARHVRLPLAITGGGGLALLAALAGWWVAAAQFSRGVGLLLLSAGVALLALGARDLPRPRRPGRNVGALALLASAAAIFLLRALGAVRSSNVNACDDLVAYYHVPKLLLETGALDEPFGFRRLGLLGVGPLLQSYFFPFWTIAASRVADATLGGLLVWGVARALAPLSMQRRAPAHVEALGLLGTLVSLSIPVANVSPILLPLGGALLLLWLTARLERGTNEAGQATALAIFWGATAALLTGLRTSNIVFPGLLGLAGAGLALAKRDAAVLRNFSLAALAFLVALAPWSLASWRSSGTPLFPLIRGNYRFPSGLLEPLSASDTLAFVASALWGSGFWLPLLLAALLGRERGWRGTACACALAAVGSIVVTALALTAVDDVGVVRYVAPFVTASALFLGATWVGTLSSAGAARERRPVSVGLGALAALLWLFLPVQLDSRGVFDEVQAPEPYRSSPAERIWRNGAEVLATARSALASGMQEDEPEGAAHFAAVQDLLDEDARIVSAVSKPFFWRFDRQRVHLVDCPGQASPPPGMPFFQGADALAAYWIGLGYTHLAFTPPSLDPCLYSMERWESLQHAGRFLWEEWAPYFKDFLRNEVLLAKRDGVVYQSPEVVVVDLRRSLSHSERPGRARTPRRAGAPGPPRRGRRNPGRGVPAIARSRVF